MNALSDMHSTSLDVSLSGAVKNRGVASQFSSYQKCYRSSRLAVCARHR